MKFNELARLYDVHGISDLRMALEFEHMLQINPDLHLSLHQLKSIRKLIETNLIPKRLASFPDQRGRQEIQEAIRYRAKIESTINQPLHEMLTTDSPAVIGSKYTALNEPIPEQLRLLIQYNLAPMKNMIFEFSRDIRYQWIMDEKTEQLEQKLKEYNLTSEDENSWDYQMTLMWLAAEMSFKELCLEEGFQVIDRNETHTIFDGQDYSVNGKPIDVKARCKMGSTVDGSYRRNRSEPGEIIAFFHCDSSGSYTQMVHTEFVGIFDPHLVEDLKYKYLKIETTKFLNPLFFVGHQGYFETKTRPLPAIDGLILRYILASEEGPSLSRALQIYDRSSLLQGLIKVNWFGQHKDIASKLLRLAENQKVHVGPLLLLNELVQIIDLKIDADMDVLRNRIFPLCGLSKIQMDFAQLLLDMISIIQNEKNRCRFTGIPFKACDIRMSKDYKTIWASPPFGDEERKNTILSYSRVTGQILRYDDPKLEKCECGCLLHEHNGNMVGKVSCPDHGDPDYQKRTKRLG